MMEAFLILNLNLNGVTSDIQTQLNSNKIHSAGTGITIDGDTINSTVSGGVNINEYRYITE